MIMWDRGLSQIKVAPILGIAQTALSKKLKGQRGFDLNEIYTLCDYFDVDPVVLLRRPEAGDSPTPPDKRAWRDSNPQPSDMESAAPARVISLEDRRRAVKAPASIGRAS